MPDEKDDSRPRSAPKPLPKSQPIFDAMPSMQGSLAFSTEQKVMTVDIGLSVDGIGGVRAQHGPLLVMAARLKTDTDIDHEVDRLIGELENLRSKAKQLLGSLKR
jgi:hypothetical protein